MLVEPPNSGVIRILRNELGERAGLDEKNGYVGLFHRFAPAQRALLRFQGQGHGLRSDPGGGGSWFWGGLVEFWTELSQTGVCF